MGKIFRFIGGAALGAALGAGVAVLFAPQSGRDLQGQIAARRQLAMDAAKAQTASRERELKAEWEARIDAETIKRRALS